MKVNTIIEFRSFINELDLKYGCITRKFLFNIFECKDRDFYILDLEKRKVIQTLQTFSLDSEWISHIEETVFYELYLEFYSNYKVFNKRNNEDTTVLTFKTLEDLQKVEQFIKDNFKFLKKGGKI